MKTIKVVAAIIVKDEKKIPADIQLIEELKKRFDK